MPDLVLITPVAARAIFLVLFLGFWVLCGFLGRKIAVDRGRSAGVGLLVGLIFGVLGLLALWLLLGESTEHKVLKEMELRRRMCELEGDDVA